MIETVVDLTYRGLALGRRIKLTQVRPTTGVLELAAPMPVGSQLVIATDDNLTLDATVLWVHEQVAGADRAAGMVVAPVLVGDAAAWWRARVTLGEDDGAAQRPRARTVTVRPRAHTQPTPPVDGPTTDEVPTIIADLDARVVAAAGLEPRPAGATSPPPIAELLMQTTGEHAIVDDGRRTMVMPIVETPDDEPDADDGDDGDDGDGPPDAGPAPTQAPAASPGGRKRRKRR